MFGVNCHTSAIMRCLDKEPFSRTVRISFLSFPFFIYLFICYLGTFWTGIHCHWVPLKGGGANKPVVFLGERRPDFFVRKLLGRK